MQKLSQDLGMHRRKNSAPHAVDRLVEHPWPGNVRELENTIERSLVLASGDVLQASDIRLEAPRGSTSHALGSPSASRCFPKVKRWSIGSR